MENMEAWPKPASANLGYLPDGELGPTHITSPAPTAVCLRVLPDPQTRRKASAPVTTPAVLVGNVSMQADSTWLRKHQPDEYPGSQGETDKKVSAEEAVQVAPSPRQQQLSQAQRFRRNCAPGGSPQGPK